ncbi:MinD/ParA family ATP-binding protein [Microbacterium dextranolyticum]|uniref:CobQ/CobB/MinD/ParA nucleotide binding domain-containing protein n=1 Tax=Microbacterium dextranolyticum TaxID=36806 RepID=A0A9W6M6V1_9MICO|nr:MinD/ParA family protein [Microbacterium dextranolyticum]MBM7462625.1 MinD-like ATPase involved in chromosome partitioning or flagellar assembly [Microbacterium dextranolyticum]GLJ96272.1 hypothetical protein GCM10017591_23350 [Microbacterium dextranolyticum]
MAHERNENSGDDADNGILADPVGAETTGIGIVDGATAQIDVMIPAVVDDDLVDDDVVLDDDASLVEWGSAPATLEPRAAATVTEAAADASHAPEEEVPEVEQVEDAAQPSAADAIEAPDADAEEPSSAHEIPAHEAPAHDDLVDDDAGQVEVAASADAADQVPTAHAADARLGDEAVPVAPRASDAVAEAGAPLTREPVAAAVAVPAHNPRPVRVAAPAEIDHHERMRPRTSEIALQSRRVGDFEADRESSDLLTADRLLDPAHVVRPEPEGAWQHLVYTLSGRRIHLGDSKRAQARKDLDRRIAAPLSGGARFVPVLSRKGGVGKTTVTTLLGMALADAREDRIIAVDANPDRGTLAERIGRPSGKTVRDLVRARADVHGFNDISQIVTRDDTRLDVLASDADPHVSEAFSDTDYRDVAEVAAHYYSVVLTDTGTGIVHSVMASTLEQADELVIVAGLSVDEARLASETLTWLESNGYADRVRAAVVVLNTARPGAPLVRADQLEAHFRSRVRAVVRLPYDPHIASGSAISFRDLQPETRAAARELAAIVVEGLRAGVTA